MIRNIPFLVRPGLVIAALVVFAASLLSREQEDALSRFKREAASGWAELEKNEAELEFVVRVTETRTKGHFALIPTGGSIEPSRK